MISAVVVVAPLARIEDKAEQIGLHKGFDIARATANDNNIVSLQNVLGALAHISSQHNLYAHLLQHSGNARLTATTLWRGQGFAGHDLAILDSKDCIVVTMTEMIIDTTVACRHSYLHTLLLYNQSPRPKTRPKAIIRIFTTTQTRATLSFHSTPAESPGRKPRQWCVPCRTASSPAGTRHPS